jgi:hypothetical protein
MQNANIVDDDVMHEVWKMKAEVSAQYPTWKDYPAYSKKLQEQAVSQGWKFAKSVEKHPQSLGQLI